MLVEEVLPATDQPESWAVGQPLVTLSYPIYANKLVTTRHAFENNDISHSQLCGGARAMLAARAMLTSAYRIRRF
eukprot:680837-Pelagomonas_calceolata.AAC.1